MNGFVKDLANKAMVYKKGYQSGRLPFDCMTWFFISALLQ